MSDNILLKVIKIIIKNSSTELWNFNKQKKI